MKKNLRTPLTNDVIKRLRSGDRIFLSGKVYTARDMAHKKLDALIKNRKKLPFNPEGNVIYYVGPTPTPPGRVIGSAGPTSSYRMDSLTEPLLKSGLKGMIGKGKRSNEIKNKIKKYKGVYFIAVGGAGVLISERIKKSKIIAFPELGPEAVRELEVEDMPLVVAYDIHGGDLFEEGKKKYKISD